MAAVPRSSRVDAGNLLDLPDQIIVHILLQLTECHADHVSRRAALGALAFMATCRRMLQLVESNDVVWAAMVRAELFLPEQEGKQHVSRERFRQLRRLTLTGLWHVVGRYAAGEAYSYDMQLCDMPNSQIWKEMSEDEIEQLMLGEPVSNPGLHAHYAVAGHPMLPTVRDSARVDWLIGDVVHPWRMRIFARCTRNMVLFSEVCSDDTPHGRWVNLCSAVVSADGTRMEGLWMQTRDGRVIVSPSNSGTFEAKLVERPPDGVEHVAWYYAKRDERRRAWAARIVGGLAAEHDAPNDDDDDDEPDLETIDDDDEEGGEDSDAPSDGGEADAPHAPAAHAQPPGPALFAPGGAA